MNEHIEFQKKLDELDCQFNGQVSRLADKNPHMSLNKIENYLLKKVCSEQTLSKLSATAKPGVHHKQYATKKPLPVRGLFTGKTNSLYQSHLLML